MGINRNIWELSENNGNKLEIVETVNINVVENNAIYLYFYPTHCSITCTHSTLFTAGLLRPHPLHALCFPP